MAKVPKLGARVRLKIPVGNPGDPAFLPAGTEGVIDEYVAAEVKGAGDDERDCVVVDIGADQGVLPRRWSHPIQGRSVNELLTEQATQLPVEPDARQQVVHQVVRPLAAQLAWDQVLEVIG